ncbi:MAG: hypothetical protein WKG06_19385 [Segetibacter sp.]
MVQESRETRKFSETPFIAASIDFAETNRKVIQIKIKNIGLGYAQNVSFEVIKDFEWVEDKPLKERGAFKNGIQSFPPNYELNYIIAFLDKEENNPLSENDYVEFKIKYDSIHDKTYLNNYKLKFNEIISQGYSTNPPLDTENAKVYYLAEINKQLMKMNEGQKEK